MAPLGAGLLAFSAFLLLWSILRLRTLRRAKTALRRESGAFYGLQQTTHGAEPPEEPDAAGLDSVNRSILKNCYKTIWVALGVGAWFALMGSHFLGWITLPFLN